MLQSAVLNNVLTEEDRQLFTKYIDFIEMNREKIMQLQNDIKYYEKKYKNQTKNINRNK